MSSVKKQFIGKPRPRPKISVAAEQASEVESPPGRTYAQVMATPSPPRISASAHRRVRPREPTPAERHALIILPSIFSAHLTISVLELSDLSRESTPTVPTMFVTVIDFVILTSLSCCRTKPVHSTRLSLPRQPMSTRASNGMQVIWYLALGDADLALV
jgi:hypothetical protein